MLKIYFLFLCLTGCFCGYSQKNIYLFVSENVQKNLNDMRLNILIPEGYAFVTNDGFECFDNNRRLNLAFTCIDNMVISNNGECIMFHTIDRLFTPKDSILFTKW